MSRNRDPQLQVGENYICLIWDKTFVNLDVQTLISFSVSDLFNRVIKRIKNNVLRVKVAHNPLYARGTKTVTVEVAKNCLTRNGLVISQTG